MRETQFTERVYCLLLQDRADELGVNIGEELQKKRDSFIKTSESNVDSLKKKMKRLVTMTMVMEMENAIKEAKDKLNEEIKKYEQHRVEGSEIRNRIAELKQKSGQAVQKPRRQLVSYLVLQLKI